MLLATVLALLIYYRMCSTDVYCSKQTGSSSTKGNHHPIISSFLELEKLSMQPKFVAAKIFKAETANIRKWIARFYLGIYTPLEARVYCSQ